MYNIIALGFFDGVHLGHGTIIKKAVEMAREQGCQSAVLTFDTPPMGAVTGERVNMITGLFDRSRLIKELYGANEVISLPFDEAMMHMEPEAFLEMLAADHGAAGIVCGYDFRFGNKGAGDAALMKRLCGQKGLTCAVVEEYTLHGRRVSSTLIRKALMNGDVELANEYLGHLHVMTGDARRENAAGFPSVRIMPDPGVMLPMPGLYETRLVADDGRVCGAVTGVGENGTVSRIVSGDFGEIPKRLRVEYLRFIEQ